MTFVPGEDQGNLPKSLDHAVDPSPAPESERDWKSTADATTKLTTNLVEKPSDLLPPLESVIGGLSAILIHCDVRSTSSKLSPP